MHLQARRSSSGTDQRRHRPDRPGLRAVAAAHSMTIRARLPSRRHLDGRANIRQGGVGANVRLGGTVFWDERAGYLARQRAMVATGEAADLMGEQGLQLALATWHRHDELPLHTRRTRQQS